ncbi:MAG: hypothetical protein ACYTKD_00935 [Planctomycetota bacterium]|jgi:CheY-like chemotaxis protein
MQKLLLIEDDESFISIFDRYFTAGGYAVEMARSAAGAFGRWAKGEPDLGPFCIEVNIRPSK